MNDDLPIPVVAEMFWDLLGCEPRYPCDLEELLLWRQPEDFGLIFEAVPGLDQAAVRRRALQLNIACGLDSTRRREHGFLLADGQVACILYDADDPPDEQRFTKAHELAHFLVDYYLPRQRALCSLGESIRPVLDGVQPPNHAQRLQAAMLRVRLDVLGNLTERSRSGRPGTSMLLAENRADRIALELLAPAGLISARLEQALPQIGQAHLQRWLTALLKDEFGLPHMRAAHYAYERIHQRGGSALADWIASQI